MLVTPIDKQSFYDKYLADMELTLDEEKSTVNTMVLYARCPRLGRGYINWVPEGEIVNH